MTDRADRLSPRHNTVLPSFSIALVSAGALAYEVLLVRLFAIIQWHHFAYMVISIALLGFGASGSFLVLFQRVLLPRYHLTYIANLLLFALAVTVCFSLAQALSFNPEELLWDPWQMGRVTWVYLLLALPFFFAATAIGISLMRFNDAVMRLYSADLTGAGIGSLSVVALLYLLSPIGALRAVTCIGLAAALAAAFELRLRASRIGMVVLCAATIGAFIALQTLGLNISPYKSLSAALQVIDAKVELERSSPLGLLSVLASRTVPLRHAPGLSLNTNSAIPEQRGIFTDADSMTALMAKGPRESFAYLDMMTHALPYHLKAADSVLILGSGGGSMIWQARYHRVPAITAVELNPQVIALIRQDYADFAGPLYDEEDVKLKIGDARGFLAADDGSYDVIQFAPAGSFNAAGAGLYAINENYLYTVQGLRDAVKRLSSDGYLAISLWIKMPPRDTLKMFATAIAALEELGQPDPGRHLLLIRSWQTSTLLVKRAPFSDAEIRRAVEFCQRRSFDVAYYPGMREAEANRFNLLQQPYYYQGARALLGDASRQYLDNYKFDLRPATDDRPYFSHFFKWRTLREIIALRGQGGVPLLESGYLIVIVTLIQAILLSVVIILLPLRYLRRRGSPAPPSYPRIAVFFGSLGLGFLFIEIAFIQKFFLFLHHPVFTVATVLSAFLIFAGAGSYWGQQLKNKYGLRRVIVAAAGMIALLCLVYVLALPKLVFAPLVGAPFTLKVFVSIVLVGCLALFMGMPFPLGISQLSARLPSMIPWAWAINGCASVISAVLATVLAIHCGFSSVVMIAAVLYLCAGFSSFF